MELASWYAREETWRGRCKEGRKATTWDTGEEEMRLGFTILVEIFLVLAR